MTQASVPAAASPSSASLSAAASWQSGDDPWFANSASLEDEDTSVAYACMYARMYVCMYVMCMYVCMYVHKHI